MVVGPWENLKGDTLFRQCLLQDIDRSPNVLARVRPNSRHDMGCAGEVRYAVCDAHVRHGEGGLEVLGSIVNARQQMAMKINHFRLERRFGALRSLYQVVAELPTATIFVHRDAPKF